MRNVLNRLAASSQVYIVVILIADAYADAASRGRYRCRAAGGEAVDDDGKSRCCAQPSSASSASNAKYLTP